MADRKANTPRLLGEVTCGHGYMRLRSDRLGKILNKFYVRRNISKKVIEVKPSTVTTGKHSCLNLKHEVTFANWVNL